MKDLSIVIIQEKEFEEKLLFDVISNMFPNTKPIRYQDGLEAYEYIIEKKKNIIVICDSHIEGITWFKLLKKIKNNDKLDSIYFIFFNSSGLLNNNIQAIEEGVDDVLENNSTIYCYITRLKIADRILKLKNNILDKTVNTNKLIKKIKADVKRELKLIKMFQKSKLPDFYKYIPSIVENVKFIMSFYPELSKSEYKSIKKAAKFCFTGRMKLPGAIKYQQLMDKGIIKNKEFEEVPNLAKNLFVDLFGMEEVATILYQLYENWDASGIPEKIQAAQISLGARIIRVAVDYYELFILYKEKESKAMEDIFAMDHKLYDYRIVTLFDQALAHQNTQSDKPTERKIKIVELEEKMTISRKVVSKSGITLLGEGLKLDQAKIDKIVEIAGTDPIIGNIYIRNK